MSTVAIAKDSNDNELYSFICSTIAAELKLDSSDFNPASELRAISGVESIVVLRIICKVEQRYNVELPDDAVFNAKTIQDLVTAVKSATEASGND